MKTAKDYMGEANAVVGKVTPEEGIAIHAEGGATFIDVRDSASIAQTGTVAGAQRLPRGLIEFAADPATPLFKDWLDFDAPYILVCGAGGQAALAGKTMIDMGYNDVRNGGGVPAWKEAGGPMEDG
ncbi:MAG: rhodanese-like domain-containing protein [Pseudomonadota bacterium]